MKNKEDPGVRNRIHNFADLKKNGNLPLDLSFSFERSGIKNLIENDEAIPHQLSEKYSVIYVNDPSGLDKKDFGNYDAVFRNASKTYHESFSTKSFAVFNKYGNDQLEDLTDKNLDDVFYLGPVDDKERSEFLITYLNQCNTYLSNKDFQSCINNFLNLHSLKMGDVKVLIPVLFLLKSFDVVHCYGLEYGSQVEDDLIFALHFTGYITLKDLYE